MINDAINRFLGVLCYPIASLEAFNRDLIQEYVDAKKEESEKKHRIIYKNIRQEIVQYIQKKYTIYSYDEIYLYLDKCYLYDVESYDNALDLYVFVMNQMATTLLSHRDGRIVFKYWRNQKDEEFLGGFAGEHKIKLFHSLNCHIPLDVIAIIYMVTNQREQDIRCLDYFYGNIEVADQQLSRLLEKGVSENHLHKGVSRTFSSIWDSLMEPFIGNKKESFNQPFLPNWSEDKNNQVLFYILGCGIVRVWLTLIIANKITLEKTPQDIHEMVEYFYEGSTFEEYYRQAFGQKKNKKKEIYSYYLNLWEKIGDFLPNHAFDEKICTLILDEDETLHTFDENVFLYYALNKLFKEKENIRFKKYLLQYLRIRNYVFHTSVQQKTIKGLDYFTQEHYRVNSILNHVNINNFWENAIREQLQSQNMHKIEFRTSMPRNAKSFKTDIKKFLEAYKKILEEDYCQKEGTRCIPLQKFPQIGLVIHFLKKPDDSSPNKCIYNGVMDCSYLQYGKLMQSYKKQIHIFTEFRSKFSELSKYLVGIDAASLENSTPVWVFAPIYEKARDSTIDSIGKNLRDGGYMQSLGFTFHAGEDFRHILSGLRRIDEAVEYLKFHAGDRIGHGIALGICAREWKKQNPVIIIPQIEALENYLWAYDTLSKNYSNFQATILSYMEKKILELARNIYGNGKNLMINTLVLAYQSLFQKNYDEIVLDVTEIDKKICSKLCLDDKKDIIWDIELLVAAKHCKRFLKEMEKPIHYEITEQDLLIIEGLQEIVMQRLGKQGIIVEINPSSNMAIADIDVFGKNQFYQLNKVFDKHNVITCINSDDPSVFNTNVSNELAYIYYGMLEQDISRETALLWIDRIRENGINSSFIRHNEPDEVLLKELNILISKL